ncbi:MAG: ATP-dependent helicase [Dermatophilaceae bacterium]
MAPPSYSAAELATATGSGHCPTPEQAAVIQAPPGPVLVVAGAGSGKTETMAARVVWLVANGHVEPDQVLGLTFTRKAATELADRVAQRLRRLRTAGIWAPRPDDEGAEVLGGTPTVSTYHSYAGRLVREHALRLGYETDSRLLSEAAAWQYAAEAVLRYDGDMSEVDRAESTIITAVVDLAAEMAEHLLSGAQVAEELDRLVAGIDATPLAPKATGLPDALARLRGRLRARRALLPVVEAFQRLKRQRDAMDFADQVALAARLALAFPDIGRSERARFRTVLLDEFQDTSEAQLVLLRSLFVAPDEPASVTAVGDPHQAIYGWRGASATTLTRFPEQFGHCGAPARVLALSTSWRNDRRILQVANLLATPLRRGGRLDVLELAPRPDAGTGDVAVARLGTYLEEATHVARWLKHARARSGVSAAVLCRKRSQFGPIVDALEEQGVPCEVVGLGGLLLTPEVEDLVAVLRVVADPSRGDALMRLLTGAMCRLGAADLDALHAWARERQWVRRRQDSGELGLVLPEDPAERDEDEPGEQPPGTLVELAPDAVDDPSIAEAIEDLPPVDWSGPDGQRIDPDARARVQGLAAAIRSLRGATGLPLADVVQQAELALGLDIEVLSRPEYTPDAARAHLDALADIAGAFTASADRPTLEGFLAWLDAALAEERGLDKGYLEPSPDAVQVLTVHAAKGLEWDCVAIPGLAVGTFPARDAGVRPVHDGTTWRARDADDPGWTSGISGIPYALRADADGLPVLRYAGACDTKELARWHAEFLRDGGRHTLAEERRLAYVAMTRARRRLLLTTAVWSTPKAVRVTSPFLQEVTDHAAELGVSVQQWADEPPADGGMDNPQAGEDRLVLWPTDPLQSRRSALVAAEATVRAELQQLMQDTSGPPERFEASGSMTPDPDAVDVEVLLAERAAAARERTPTATLPGHLSASGLVQLAADPHGFATALRRPMPSAPALAARRGTAFHAWVEQHYASAALVDVTDLPGSADPDGAAGDEDLPTMKAHFLASPWASCTPVAVEIAVETVIDGIAVRGRIDAVFPRDDGGFTIVDWKTGAEPSMGAARVRALQLGAYAVAYRRLRRLPADAVDAAFYYARTGRTVRPSLPGEAELLQLLRTVPA